MLKGEICSHAALAKEELLVKLRRLGINFVFPCKNRVKLNFNHNFLNQSFLNTKSSGEYTSQNFIILMRLIRIYVEIN